MNQKRIALYAILLCLLTGGIILCTVRWKAWFGNPEEPVWQQDTVVYRFRTFAEDSLPTFQVHYEQRGRQTVPVWHDTATPDSLVFIMLGDVHNGIDSLQWEMIYQRHPQVDFYAQLGDFIERGYFYYAQQLVSELEGTPFEALPVVTTPGNHEYRKGIVRRLPSLWYELFPQPKNGPKRFIGTTYFVDFPQLRLIAIDTNGLQRISDYTQVNTWVSQAIQDAGDRFVVVMMHHPVYSSAKGRQNVPVYITFRRILQQADLVFTGHDHTYARRLPFVGINSARKFYRAKESDKNEVVCSERQLYELVTLSRDTLTVETREINSGEQIDYFQL